MDTTMIEGAVYLCKNPQGRVEAKFYHDGLFWDAILKDNQYIGNSLPSRYVEVTFLANPHKSA